MFLIMNEMKLISAIWGRGFQDWHTTYWSAKFLVFPTLRDEIRA